MSNRYMDKNRSSFLKETVDVFADVKIGAAGTATLISHIPGPTGLDVTASVAAPGFQGVYNIVGPSGGVVTFNMQDAYYRLLPYN